MVADSFSASKIPDFLSPNLAHTGPALLCAGWRVFQLLKIPGVLPEGLF